MQLNYKEITQERNFHASNEDRYLMDKLIVKVTVEEGQDKFEVAEQIQKDLCEMHRRNNPHLYQNNPLSHGVQQTIKVPAEIPNTHVQPEPEYKTAIQLLKEKQDAEIDAFITTIGLVKSIKNLEIFKTRVDKNNDPSNPKHQQLQEVYNNKEKELKQTA